MLPGQEYIVVLIFLVLTALAGLNSFQLKVLIGEMEMGSSVHSVHLRK